MTLLRRSLILMGICLVPIVLMQAVNTWELRRSRSAEIQSGAQQQVVSVSSDLAQLFDGFGQLLMTLAVAAPVREREPFPCRTLLATVLEHNGFLSTLGAADRNGRVFCVGAEGPEQIDMTAAPYSIALETDEFAVGTLRETIGGVTALPMAAPIRDETGAAIGVLWATVTPDALNAYFRRRTLPANYSLLIADREGVILVSSPDESLVGEKLPSVLGSYVDSKVLGTIETKGPDDVQRLFGYVPVTLRPVGFFVAVGIDKEAAFAPLDRAMWRAFMFISIGAVLGFGAAVFGSRHVLQRPIGRLVRAARRWQEGDLTARAALDPGASEIATLGRAFDEMAAALETREAELMEAKQRAEQRAAEAEAAERQKTVLLQEVNHRVKNSLQLVSSLLNLQAASVRDEEVRNHFTSAGARVQTIARVHSRLFQTSQVGMVEFGQYLRDLCEDLRQSFGQPEARPRFDVSTEPIELSTDRVIPLALIVNELLTNVFKYAYPNGDGENVRVRVQSHREGDRLIVEVCDEGVGLPADFDPGRGGGLGMRLVVALTNQLDAELQVVRQEKGATFRVVVPLVQEMASQAAK